MSKFSNFPKVLKNKNLPRPVLLAAVFAVIGVAALLFAKAATNTASLSLSPSGGTYNNGDTVTVSVYEDSGTSQVSAVDLGLVYDTAKLQFLSADTTGSSFTPATPIAANGGTVVITSYINPGTITAGNVTGKQLIAKVSFKTLAGSGSTSISFLKEAPSDTAKSAVYLYKTTTNIWDGVTTGGTYTLTTPDVTKPTITNSQPANGATVNGTVNVSSTITDDRGTVSSAQLFINGSASGLTMTAGANNMYSYSWNTTTVADGTYTLVVKATDPAGNQAVDTTRTVTVQNAKPDLVVSSLTMSPSAPQAGNAVTITATIKNQGALATTAGLANVTGFTMDGSSIGTPSNTTAIAAGGTIQATATWTATAGSHTVAAVADKNNVIAESNESNNSTSSSFSVAVPDTSAPSFSGALALNQSASRVSGSLTITANVTDNVGVTKVEFYVDGSLKSTDTSSTYSYNWNSASVGDGQHSLQAKAYDAAGNVGTSAVTTVTVKNTPDAGDTDNNGKIDSNDLLAVLNHWQAGGQSRSNGDLTGDGVVNILDLLQVLNNWSAS
jgi:hypothetical protein